MVVKSFRGLIDTGAQETISLHTNDGSTGYRIVKFECLNKNPGTAGVEGVLKVYTIPQTAIDGVVDFSDNTLLAAAFYENNTSDSTLGAGTIITFDNVTFNQDIYVTYTDVSGSSQAMNYHIELEMVKLDLNENTVATLKDIRNIEGQPFTSTP